MAKRMRTRSGTEIEDGIEYSTYPPPDCLVKVMKRCWAERLLFEGAIRFASLAYYRKLENSVLGDPNDGEGMLRMNGHPFEVGSINSVYAWCSSLTTITPERINVLAMHGDYDCLVRINQPSILIKRVQLAKSKYLHLHCAEISYSRGTEVDKMTLYSQKFHFNIFQKDERFSEDREFRLTLTDNSLKPEYRFYIDLRIGECSDIMEIKKLPVCK